MKYNKEENYCSMSPESILGVTYNYGCFLHDRQYRNEVKNRKTRKQADILLRETIYRILKNSNSPFELRLRVIKLKINILFFKSESNILISARKLIAKPWSYMYYYGVRIFAKGAYK